MNTKQVRIKNFNIEPVNKEEKYLRLKLYIFDLVYKLYAMFLLAMVIYFNVDFFNYRPILDFESKFNFIFTTTFLHLIVLILQTISWFIFISRKLSFSDYLFYVLLGHSCVTIVGFNAYIFRIIPLMLRLYEKIGLFDINLILIYLNFLYFLPIIMLFVSSVIENIKMNVSIFFYFYSFSTLLFTGMSILNIVNFTGIIYPLVFTLMVFIFNFIFVFPVSFLAYKTLKEKILRKKILFICWSILIILTTIQEMLYVEKASAFLGSNSEFNKVKHNFLLSDERYNPANISLLN